MVNVQLTHTVLSADIGSKGGVSFLGAKKQLILQGSAQEKRIVRDAMRTTKPTGATQLLLYISILTLLFSGAGVLTLASGSDEGSAYLDRVEQKIMAGWKLPPQSNGLKVVLRMQLEKSGKVSQVRVEKSSGNKTFDESAVAAVRKANPFPIVPETAKMLLGDLGMVLEPDNRSEQFLLFDSNS
jgi:periplasmic protein TonB